MLETLKLDSVSASVKPRSGTRINANTSEPDFAGTMAQVSALLAIQAPPPPPVTSQPKPDSPRDSTKSVSTNRQEPTPPSVQPAKDGPTSPPETTHPGGTVNSAKDAAASSQAQGSTPEKTNSPPEPQESPSEPTQAQTQAQTQATSQGNTSGMPAPGPSVPGPDPRASQAPTAPVSMAPPIPAPQIIKTNPDNPTTAQPQTASATPAPPTPERSAEATPSVPVATTPVTTTPALPNPKSDQETPTSVQTAPETHGEAITIAPVTPQNQSAQAASTSTATPAPVTPDDQETPQPTPTTQPTPTPRTEETQQPRSAQVSKEIPHPEQPSNDDSKSLKAVPSQDTTATETVPVPQKTLPAETAPGISTTVLVPKPPLEPPHLNPEGSKALPPPVSQAIHAMASPDKQPQNPGQNQDPDREPKPGQPVPNSETLASMHPRIEPTLAPSPGTGLDLPSNGLAASIGGDPARTTSLSSPSATPAPARALPVFAQVEGSIRWLLQNKSQSAELQLHPESLGRVTIHLRVEGGQVHAQLWATESASVPLLQDHKAFLEASLREQGLSLGSFELHSGPRRDETPTTPQEKPVIPASIMPIQTESKQEVPTLSIVKPAGSRRIELLA